MGWPMLWLILSVMARAMMSVVLPAENGTMTRMGLLGYPPWARAARGHSRARLAMEAVMARRLSFMVSPEGMGIAINCMVNYRAQKIERKRRGRASPINFS